MNTNIGVNPCDELGVILLRARHGLCHVLDIIIKWLDNHQEDLSLYWKQRKVVGSFYLFWWVWKRSNAACIHTTDTPDIKVPGANMGPTWDLSAPDGPHVGPTNLAIRGRLRVMTVSDWCRLTHTPRETQKNLLQTRSIIWSCDIFCLCCFVSAFEQTE